MPAANARALEKAKDIPCDAIIFDLEDAVAPDSKALARDQAVAAVTSGEYGGRELTIRCNGLATPWGADDLAAAGAAAPSAVVIPKVDSTAYLDEVAAGLDAAGADGHVDLGDGRDADGDLRRPGASPPTQRVSVLVLGHQRPGQGDPRPADPRPVATCSATWPRPCSAPGRPARSSSTASTTTCATPRASPPSAARASRWASTARRSCTPARSSRPTTAWSPTDDEVELSRRVIAAYQEAEAEGRGVVTVDGKMIEHLHVANAQRTLAIADAIAALTR